MSDTFRYWAFLSYSHADEAFARKLHLSLERYALPRRLRKAHALPRRLVPVFRDVEELEAAHGLTERLQAALDESRWLVVLCSPAAAKSKYVNAEIEYFIGKHGAQRVLCALVEGEPADSFPPAIKALKDEPLAADLRPGRDFELGRLKLIAAMAMVGFTELRNREAQRRRRQRTAIAAFVAGILIGAVGYWDLFYREHIDYYLGYARHHGIWHGTGPVSADLASHRRSVLRFSRKGRLNPPERVDLVNGSDGFDLAGLEDILGHKDNESFADTGVAYTTVLFGYDRDGAIRHETLVNRLGAPRLSLTYTAPDLAQLTQQGFEAPAAGGGVRYVQFQRDAAGLDQRILFLHARGVPRANLKRAYGYAFAYDGAGRLSARSVLDDRGEEVGEVTRFTYSAEGFLLSERSEDQHGELRTNLDGYAVLTHVNDEFGNPVESRYLARDGKPVLGPAGLVFTSKYASARRTYDLRGNTVRACYFDEQGQPIDWGVGAPCEAAAYDERGRQVRMDLLDGAGKPTAEGGGVASMQITYDAAGNMEEVRSYDLAGKLTEQGGLGASIVRYKFDAKGHELEASYFDAERRPVMSPYGASMRTQYDERDHIAEFMFLDTAGKPFVRPDRGMACVRVTRDERGNVIEASSLGANLEPVIRLDGYSFMRQVYDDVGNVIERRLFDTRKNPTRDENGVALYRRGFDRFGRQIEETYFDERERPTLHKKGYYGYRSTFDNRGREEEVRYLDADKRPWRVPALGFAGMRYRYNRNGQIEQQEFLDAIGGLARREYRYDDYGNELERRYFSADGAPARSAWSGCAVEATDYDERGNQVGERCLDTAGKPTDRIDEHWAVRRIVRDHGRIISDERFDVAGRKVALPAKRP
jgi:hypothetical protein